MHFSTMTYPIIRYKHSFCVETGMRLIPFLLLSLAMASCGKVKDPEFRKLENFGIRKIGLQETVVGFNARYFNPNSFNVNVKETSLDVYIDSGYVGKFTQTQDISVQDNSDFSIPLEARIGIADALALNLQDLIGKEVHVEAKGSVKVGKGGVYITRNINYSGRHKLDRSLLKNPAAAGL